MCNHVLALPTPNLSIPINIILKILIMKSDVEYRAEIVSGKPILYRRISNQDEWDDITENLYDLDDMEFYDINLNYSKFSALVRKLSGLIYKITLGSMCYHLKMGDRLLWSYCMDPFQRIPFELLFNLENNTMNLLLSDGTIWSLDMEGYDNDWVQPGKPLEKFNEMKSITHENFSVYIFGEKKPCYVLKVNDEIIWKHKENEPFPVSCIDENDTLTLVFPINIPYFTHSAKANNEGYIKFAISFKP